MVDSISTSLSGTIAPKIDTSLARSDARVEQNREDERRTDDVVEISEQAQKLAIEETAKVARQQIEETQQPLSGGRVDALI